MTIRCQPEKYNLFLFTLSSHSSRSSSHAASAERCKIRTMTMRSSLVKSQGSTSCKERMRKGTATADDSAV